MNLKFTPSPGMVLICDFDTGFKPPEMIKKCPVVVISKTKNNWQLCSVVPLSTKAPFPVEGHHHKIGAGFLPGRYGEVDTWAKCDLITTVAKSRLDRLKVGKDGNGKRIYLSPSLSKGDFQAIKNGVLIALGLTKNP